MTKVGTVTLQQDYPVVDVDNGIVWAITFIVRIPIGYGKNIDRRVRSIVWHSRVKLTAPLRGSMGFIARRSH